MGVNDVLRDKMISHQIGIERYKASQVAEMRSVLEETGNGLAKRISDAGDAIETGSVRRMKELRDDIPGIIEPYSAKLQSMTMGDPAMDLVGLEEDFAVKALTDSIPVDINLRRPSVEHVFGAAMAKPFEGMNVEEMVRRHGQNAVDSIDRTLRQGVVEGASVDDLVRRIRGTKSLNYTDGLVHSIGNGGRTVVRTGIQNIVTTARDEVYKANEEVLKGIQWVATLDGRTTLICASRDGQVYDLHEGPRPPAHWNCRSTTVPVTKSWKELGFDKEEVPPGTRSSMDGQVPATQDFDSWLRDQPVEFQREFLGQRYEMFAEGARISQFVSDDARPIDLRALKAQVFGPTPLSEIDPGESGADDFGKRLTRTEGTLGGSNDARLYVDDEGGEWVVKQYRGNELQVQNEWVANQLYKEIGVDVPEARIARIDGTLGIASRRLPDDFRVGRVQDQDFISSAAKMRRGFVADSYLANWDVVGMDLDNIMYVPGEKGSITRIDQGGALLFRARGGDKGSAFGVAVRELDTLRDAQVNPRTAHVFAQITDKDIANQIGTLVDRVDNDAIERIVAQSGMSGGAGQRMVDILQGRRDNLLEWRRAYWRGLTASKKARAAPGGAQAFSGTVFDAVDDRGMTRSGQIVPGDKDRIAGHEFQFWRSRKRGNPEMYTMQFRLNPEYVSDARTAAERNIGGGRTDTARFMSRSRFRDGVWEYDSDTPNPLSIRSRKYMREGVAVELFDEPGSYTMFGTVKVSVTGDRSTAMGQFRKVMDDLGLGDSVSAPTAEDVRKRALAQYAWQNVPSAAPSGASLAQMSLNDIEDLIRRETGGVPEVETRRLASGRDVVTVNRAQQLRDQGARSIFTGVTGDPSSLADIVEEGMLVPAKERVRRGLFHGSSVAADMENGGGDNVFFRLIGAKSQTRADRYFASGNAQFVFGVDELNRTDWHAYGYDSYGTTRGPTFNSRLSAQEFVRRQVDTPTHGNEVMIRGGTDFRNLAEIRMQRPELRNGLLEELRRRGVTEINGRKVEDFIVLSDELPRKGL